MSKHPAIFLDRDGVIIENRANYVRSWADVAFFPQALNAMARIRELPVKIIMVTNQSAVGRGIITLAEAEAINNRVIAVVREADGRIDATYLCPAAPQENNPCRKPQPGMLLQAAAEHDLDLSRSIMIGDALTDVLAGRAAGVRAAALLRSGRGEAQLALPQAAELAPIPIFADLTAALHTYWPT